MDEPTVTPEHLSAAAEQLHARLRSAAAWYFWITGFCLINSIIILFKGKVGLLGAISIAQFIAMIGAQSGKVEGKIVAFLGVLLISAFWAAAGYFAQRNIRWIMILGFVLYAIDALIFLSMKDWLDLAFHGYVLFGLWQGIMAMNQLHAMAPLLAAAPIGSVVPPPPYQPPSEAPAPPAPAEPVTPDE
jgi:hypothetical protein